jgi:hypothetical protein
VPGNAEEDKETSNQGNLKKNQSEKRVRNIKIKPNVESNPGLRRSLERVESVKNFEKAEEECEKTHDEQLP